MEALVKEFNIVMVSEMAKRPQLRLHIASIDAVKYAVLSSWIGTRMGASVANQR